MLSVENTINPTVTEILDRFARLTYIGKSKQICERLYIQDLMNKNGHNYGGIRAKPIPWDVVTSLVLESGRECSPGLSRLLTEYERIYIATYQPPFNQDFQDGFT